MMCQFHHSICGEELKKKEEKMVQWWCVRNILWRRADCPPETYDKLLGLIVDDDNSADAAITITSADDVIIIDDETKKKIEGQKEKEITPKDEFYASYLKKRQSTYQQWINWCNHQILNLPWWYGRAPQHLSIYYDEDINDNLDEYPSVYMTLWYPSSE